MLRALYPIFNTGQGVAYTCRSICQNMQAPSMEAEAWFPSSAPGALSSCVRNAYPMWMMPLIFRLPKANSRLAKAVEKAFLKALKQGDIAYLWPGVSLETYRQIKGRGITIVTERINCHTRFSKIILDKEFARIGLEPSHGITDQSLAQEDKELEIADLIFAPNQFVIESLLQSGVPREKILATSYGWDPIKLKGRDVMPSHTEKHIQEKGVTALFVGSLCVRKGVHLLLEAWARSGVRGRLLFSGAVAADLASHSSEALDRMDITLLGHVSDVGSVYRSADFFVFPSLEEGGPMVTFEAMGCGLPVIVSPMGAGPAREGIDGFIIDPYDIDGWSDAIRKLAEDGELRKRMSVSAKERAEEFTWERVGQRRREILEKAMCDLVSKHEF